MAHAGLDGSRVGALGDGHGHRRMSQVVEGEPVEADPGLGRVPMGRGEARRMDGFPARFGNTSTSSPGPEYVARCSAVDEGPERRRDRVGQTGHLGCGEEPHLRRRHRRRLDAVAGGALEQLGRHGDVEHPAQHAEVAVDRARAIPAFSSRPATAGCRRDGWPTAPVTRTGAACCGSGRACR